MKKEDLETPFERIVAPNCAMQLKHDQESSALSMAVAPRNTDRTKLYALLEAAKQKEPDDLLGLYLPTIRPAVQLGIVIIKWDEKEEIEFATTRQVPRFFLHGLLAMAAEIVLDKGGFRPALLPLQALQAALQALSRASPRIHRL
jgi:hypothetical protein